MKDRSSCYHLRVGFDGPTPANKEWRDQALGKNLCVSCSDPLNDHHAFDIRLMDHVEKYRLTLGYLYGNNVGFALRHFLDVLTNSRITEFFELANVFEPTGNGISAMSVFAPIDKLVTIRGDERSVFRYCGECGKLLYAPFGTHYLCASELRGREIVVTQFKDFVVSPEVAARVKEQKWHNLKIYKISVVDAPRDGFGDLPLRNPLCISP